MATIIFTVH